MANTYKDIVITPNKGSSTDDPKIVFSGANTSVNTDITLRVYPDSNGSLSFEGSAGQLFSVTNDLTGSIFSVNDVSGLPLIEANVSSQQITLAQFYGNVGIGTSNAIYGFQISNDVVAITGTAPIVSGLNDQLTQTPFTVNPAIGQYVNTAFTSSVANQPIYGILNTPSANSNGNYTFHYGIYNAPRITDSPSGSLLLTGMSSLALRSSNTDSATTASLYGLQAVVGNYNTSNTAKSYTTSGAFGVLGTIYNLNGSIGVTYGGRFETYIATTANTTGTGTTAYGIYVNATVGSSSGTGTGTLTTWYDAYLGGATAAATGTVTNKWGVYQANATHNNYFNGNVAIGRTTSAGGYKLDVVGTVNASSVLVNGTALPLATGTGASGTWPISISANAALLNGFTSSNSANPVAANTMLYNGLSYVSSQVGQLGQTDGALYSQAYSTVWVHQIYGDYRTGQIALRGMNNGTWQPWRIVVDNSNLYTYLATPPAIGGTTANTGAFTTLTTSSTANISTHLLSSYSASNFQVTIPNTGAAGILLRSSNQFGAQLYGDGTAYGFLGSAWGAWDFRKVISGNAYFNNDTTCYLNPAVTSRFNNIIVAGGIASDANTAYYYDAAVEVRELNYGGAQADIANCAPRIGMHWGGRVASQIVLESSGRIAIRNNPGSDYEAFAAGNMTGSGTLTVAGNAIVNSNITLGSNGNINFTQSNPYITASSYIIMPGGLYVSGGTAYFTNQTQHRGGIHTDTAAYLTIAGGTSGISYFSGNVGIGNTAPTLSLEVAGNMSVDAFVEFDQTISTSYTISGGRNALTAGPITINSGVTVTVPSGSVWTIV